MKRVTVDMPDAVYRDLKMAAAREGTSVRKIVLTALGTNRGDTAALAGLTALRGWLAAPEASQPPGSM